MPSGGYRKPEHPAAVSGPGSLSARTDGKDQPKRAIPAAAYGEQAQYDAAQSAGAMQGPSITPFTAGTTRPGEPVTAGAALGPGGGPQQAGISMDMAKADAHNMKSLVKSLEIIASLPGSNPSTRDFVRQLRANG